MLTVGPTPDIFTVHQKPNSDIWRVYQCMANSKGETCFVIGGMEAGYERALETVSRYNIIKAQWEQGTPNLHVPRYLAAACSLGDYLIVVGGIGGVDARVHWGPQDNSKRYLNSIEMINVTTLWSHSASWELIEPP